MDKNQINIERYDYKFINKKMERVAERYGSHIGNRAYVRHDFPEILRPTGFESGKSGMVMSYEEAYERKRRGTHKDIPIDFTREYYESEVRRFYSTYGYRLDLRKESARQRREAMEIIEDAFEYMEESVPENLKKMSYEELREIIRDANEYMSDHHIDKTNSPTFYERIVEKLMGNGDAEAQ